MRNWLFFIIFFSAGNCLAQNPQTVATLANKHRTAANDSLRIAALEELADYYYAFRADSKGDSIVQMQLDIAEHSENKNLRLFTLFAKGIGNIHPWSTATRYKKTLDYLDEGLKYAEKMGNDKYVTVAHIRKANVYRKKGDHENAIVEISRGFLSLEKEPNDSLKARLFLELANIYKGKKDEVAAYQSFNNAFHLAYAAKNLSLQIEVYHSLANFYRSIRENDLAIDNLKKSLEINKKIKDEEGIWADYLELAKITDDKSYYDKALDLANKLGSEKKILQSKYVMFAYYMTVDTNFLALQYLTNNRDLQQYYLNQGIGDFYFTLGNIYYWDPLKRHPDSAVHYYTLAEKELKSIYDKTTLTAIYQRLGEAYIVGNHKKAIEYLEKALGYARETGAYDRIPVLLQNLSSLYTHAKDYNKAYSYLFQHSLYKDSLQKLTNTRQLVFLEIEKDRTKKILDEKEAAEAFERKQNLQYMGITIAIAVVFIAMLVFGMFPISKFTIKALSFFAFICLFEFIIVMIDGYLHHKFHGDTLSIWLTKIVIIAMLLPLHHFMEHAAVKFLESKKLLRLRSQFSLKKLFTNYKKLRVKRAKSAIEIAPAKQNVANT